jgi:DNA-binding Lrp family transcriptional regulator
MRRTAPTLDATDRAVINALQAPLALTERPFAAPAAALGLTEDALIDRLRALLDAGALTRFGPFWNADALGGAFCLCAMAVPAEQFDAVAEAVNALPQVAHNYARDHRLNLWFVLATETPEGIEAAARAIEATTGLTVLRFPKEEEFFIGFRVAA